MLLTEKSVGIRICTPCTLNCKLCAANTALYKSRNIHYFVSLENFQRELKQLFKIYDRIGTISIAGGEPLLHKQLPQIVAYTLSEWKDHFDELRITTNGTLLPGSDLLNTIHCYADHNVLFVLDDYGEVSFKVQELKGLLVSYGIPYRVNCYSGAEQHCGGWVDFGPINQRRSYLEEEANELVSRCHFGQWKCLDCFEGKLYLCPIASCGDYLHFFDLKRDEYIDLFDISQSVEEKQRTASEFGKKAITACWYCNGFDPEKSQRFPAGIQINNDQ